MSLMCGPTWECAQLMPVCVSSDSGRIHRVSNACLFSGFALVWMSRICPDDPYLHAYPPLGRIVSVTRGGPSSRSNLASGVVQSPMQVCELDLPSCF